MSHSYQEFPEDVLNAFEAVIQLHKLTVEKREDHYVGLSNEFVEINFSFDRGDLYAELSKKNDDFTFAIYQIYKHLYGSIAEENYQNSKIVEKKLGYPKTELVWFAQLFENELSSILMGNFEWYEAVRSAQEYERQLVAVVLGPHLPHPNDISVKFWNGDPTWRQDIEKFIKDEGIELKPFNNNTLPKPRRSWWQKLFGSE